MRSASLICPAVGRGDEHAGGHAACLQACCLILGWLGILWTAEHPGGHLPGKFRARLGTAYMG